MFSITPQSIPLYRNIAFLQYSQTFLYYTLKTTTNITLLTRVYVHIHFRPNTYFLSISSTKKKRRVVYLVRYIRLYEVSRCFLHHEHQDENVKDENYLKKFLFYISNTTLLCFNYKLREILVSVPWIFFSEQWIKCKYICVTYMCDLDVWLICLTYMHASCPCMCFYHI